MLLSLPFLLERAASSFDKRSFNSNIPQSQWEKKNIEVLAKPLFMGIVCIQTFSGHSHILQKTG